MGGRLGLEIDLTKVPAENCSDLEVLFSESNSRFIATVPQEKAAAFEKLLDGVPFARVGVVTGAEVLALQGKDGKYVVPVERLVQAYKETLDQI